MQRLERFLEDGGVKLPMQETIELLKEKAPWCKVVVGGAVLNQEYADRIGADRYARDAMETIRYADKVDNAR